MPTANSIKDVKRLIGIIAITLGTAFTLVAILSIWEVIDFGHNTIVGKLIPTLGVLTVAFIALLGILKMLEDKK